MKTPGQLDVAYQHQSANASWKSQFPTPKLSNKITTDRQNYGVVMDTTKKLMKTIEKSPERIRNVIASMEKEIRSAENENLDATIITLSPLDPIPIPGRGRKRGRRIKSSTEAKSPKRYAKFNVKEMSVFDLKKF